MPITTNDSFDSEPRLDRRTLTDVVYDDLREQLVGGCLAPGERLSLREIGARLGVSVMPVREAINRLVAERALEITQGRVLRVPTTSSQQVRDLTDIRVVVEGFAAERAATMRTDAQFEEIERAEAALRIMTTSSALVPADWITLNRQFHFRIYQAARLPVLSKLITDLWLRAGPFINLDIRPGSNRLTSAGAGRHHTEAVQAIRDRDGPAARSAIANDIATTAAYIIDHSKWLVA